MTVNKAILVGRLGNEPEVRYTSSGTAVVNVSVATTSRYKDSSGQKHEETEWHNVSVFGRAAEVLGEYARKGGLVYVEGRLRTRKWTDKEGNERSTTEVLADNIQMLGSREGEKGSKNGSAEKPKAAKGAKKDNGGIADLEDEIPF